MYSVIYNSRTGFTKKYAEQFAKLSGVDCHSIDDDFPTGDVVFFGWRKGPMISGIKSVASNRIIAVCVVGLQRYDESTIDTMKKKNKLDCPLFYRMGGVDRDALPISKKIILDIFAWFFQKKDKCKDTEAMVQIIRYGGSMYSEDQLNGLIEYVRSKQSDDSFLT